MSDLEYTPDYDHQDVENFYHEEAEQESIPETIEHEINDDGEAVMESYDNAVEALQETHISEAVPEAVEDIKQDAVETVEEEKPKKVDEAKETAESELKGAHRPRSGSGRLSGMIGMFEKKVEEINSSLTPGVNKPPPARSNSFGRRPSIEEDDRKNQDESPKPSPRGGYSRPSSNVDVKEESPRPRSGSLKDRVGMFEKKVEDLNKSLTPGVNSLAPKPPKPATTVVRKNSFGKKLDEDESTEPQPKKTFKWDVKVTSLTSEKKNTALLQSAVKEESWDRPKNVEDDEERPRRSALDDRKKQWENA